MQSSAFIQSMPESLLVRATVIISHFCLPSSSRRRIWLVRIDAKPAYGLRDPFWRHVAILHQRCQRGDDNIMTVHLKEMAQLFTRIRAPKTIRSQNLVTPRHEFTYLIRENF